MYKTENYFILEKNIRTEDECRILSNTLQTPHIYVERCSYLLADFIEEYIDTSIDEIKLNFSLRKETILALVFSIQEQLIRADAMLKECVEYSLLESKR